MRANKSSISGKNIYLNSKTQQIDAKLDIVANNNPIGVTVKGDVNSPKVNVDAEKLLEQKAKKAVDKELNKLFRKLF